MLSLALLSQPLNIWSCPSLIGLCMLSQKLLFWLGPCLRIYRCVKNLFCFSRIQVGSVVVWLFALAWSLIFLDNCSEIASVVRSQHPVLPPTTAKIHLQQAIHSLQKGEIDQARLHARHQLMSLNQIGLVWKNSGWSCSVLMNFRWLLIFYARQNAMINCMVEVIAR